MTTTILTHSFYLLFFLTPLIWTSFNYELFEYPKMIFVYLLTTIITTLWIWKMVRTKTLLFKTTFLDVPLLIFLAANILSVIFSIDQHVSIWGYYSRGNGGLLSITSYLLLYWALVSNFEAKQILKFLKATILGGVVVSLYAIPEHFGVSPSCLILTGRLDAACWVQDVQARVFATLGQPNWLAGYLAALIFPTLYFALTSLKLSITIRYTLYAIIFYLAFTFTYSRGATLGLLVGLLFFLLFSIKLITVKQRKVLFSITCFFLLSTLIFGSALTDFKLFSKFSAPSRPSVATGITKPAGTQLENGGTESGQIRLIVWEGALEIFKNYPIFGSGVETFAYSYYQFRPASHNLVSEWDFLYNKAHNEFLNYLATTGFTGFISYMAIITVFLVWGIKFIFESGKFSLEQKLLTLAILSSYISILIYNFFLFSVVTTALLFYLLPAMVFALTDSTRELRIPALLSNWSSLTKKGVFNISLQIIILIAGTTVMITFLRYFWADTYFANGSKAGESGNTGKAYNELLQAVTLNPGEPLYRSELSFTAASAALSLENENSTTSARLVQEAVEETERILRENTNNTSLHRSAIRTYYLLSAFDKSFAQKAIAEFDQTLKLAPTDAKLAYNKALILQQTGEVEKATELLQHITKLKPNYREAYIALANLYHESGEIDKAVLIIKQVLAFIPNDPEVLDKLKEWVK